MGEIKTKRPKQNYKIGYGRQYRYDFMYVRIVQFFERLNEPSD
jgi:hypothetical protein